MLINLGNKLVPGKKNPFLLIKRDLICFCFYQMRAIFSILSHFAFFHSHKPYSKVRYDHLQLFS